MTMHSNLKIPFSIDRKYQKLSPYFALFHRETHHFHNIENCFYFHWSIIFHGIIVNKNYEMNEMIVEENELILLPTAMNSAGS